MEHIRDMEKLSYWLSHANIRACFDTPDLPFQLVRYQKGEYLSSPDTYFENLLFVVQGSVRVYGVRADGSISPVSQADKPAIIGDIEFSLGGLPPFFAQAQTEVTCVCLPVPPCRAQLEHDFRFLHVLLRSYAEKLQTFATMEIPTSTIEERVLLYLKHASPAHELNGVGPATFQLRCSRRQLQRVLRDLCVAGKIEKTGKGRYRLVQSPVRSGQSGTTSPT